MKWDQILLLNYIRDNPGKPKRDCLDLMIGRLQDLQECLPQEYKPELLLCDRIMRAVDNIEECRLARQDIPNNIEDVIPKLHTSISTAET